jgi:hypothetical protein
MHPVARVSIKYWNNLRKQQSIFSARFYCAHKNKNTVLRTEVFQYLKVASIRK